MLVIHHDKAEVLICQMQALSRSPGRVFPSRAALLCLRCRNWLCSCIPPSPERSHACSLPRSLTRCRFLVARTDPEPCKPQPKPAVQPSSSTREPCTWHADWSVSNCVFCIG